MEKQSMDRGTDALKAHLGGTPLMEIRQTRRGWCQEILGCEARTEFRYLVNGDQVATSLEESNCCMRIFCTGCYSYHTPVTEMNTNAELLTVDRPCKCPAGSCKCCCYQQAMVSSGGSQLGTVKETCYFCVPSVKIFNDRGEEIYLVHPPTCCGGCCMNCFTEGNPCCGRGCCKVPFWIFPAGQANTNGDAPHLGKILKKPKSLMTEVFTEANAFDVHFPTEATVEQKALLVGSAILLNTLFFEDSQGGNN